MVERRQKSERRLPVDGEWVYVRGLGERETNGRQSVRDWQRSAPAWGQLDRPELCSRIGGGSARRTLDYLNAAAFAFMYGVGVMGGRRVAQAPWCLIAAAVPRCATEKSGLRWLESALSEA